MAKRKHVHHGSRRKVRKVLAISGTGAQALSVQDADIVKMTTAGGSTTAVTLSITDAYAGQHILIDFDSNIAGDTLVVTVNGAASSVDVVTAITANQRNLVEVYILDADSGSEKGSLEAVNVNVDA